MIGDRGKKKTNTNKLLLLLLLLLLHYYYCICNRGWEPSLDLCFVKFFPLFTQLKYYYFLFLSIVDFCSFFSNFIYCTFSLR